CPERRETELDAVRGVEHAHADVQRAPGRAPVELAGRTVRDLEAEVIPELDTSIDFPRRDRVREGARARILVVEAADVETGICAQLLSGRGGRRTEGKDEHRDRAHRGFPYEGPPV